LRGLLDAARGFRPCLPRSAGIHRGTSNGIVLGPENGGKARPNFLSCQGRTDRCPEPLPVSGRPLANTQSNVTCMLVQAHARSALQQESALRDGA
jgi:hypothetical protein